MKNRFNGSFVAIIGVIVISFTLISFLLFEFEKTSLSLWALGFLILSELALFVGLSMLAYRKAKHHQVFLISGLSVSLFLYFLTALVCTFFSGLFKNNVNQFLMLELSVLVFFAIVIIVVLAFSRRIAGQDGESLEAQNSDLYTKPKRGGF